MIFPISPLERNAPPRTSGLGPFARAPSALLLWALLGCQRAHPESPKAHRPPAGELTDSSPPSDLYGDLFKEVQLSTLFSDSKTFADAIAKRDPASIMDRYQTERPRPGFHLAGFVREEFELPRRPETGFRSAPGQEIREHIRSLWPVLARPADGGRVRSSRLPLPYPYVVPGGRFDELYYWDSYFTMLGLDADGQSTKVRDLCQNFAHLVQTYGHIPNGNRTYYLSRSQPPFFALMIELTLKRDDPGAFREFAPILEREYAFWMDGGEGLAPGRARRRVVRLRDGSLLNRYFDDRDTPRDEAYREDIETARLSNRPPSEVYRNLRAAAESGWDFSSRWLSEDTRLDSIRTIELIPIDLNALLYGVERTLERAFADGDPARSERFGELAEVRKASIARHLWDEDLGAFTDLVWKTETSAGRLTAATLVPLFTGASAPDAADRVAMTVEQKLLAVHGLLTSQVTSGQQWDAPNGWAPLVWMASSGLRRYEKHAIAEEIERRWILRNRRTYEHSGKLVEKYDVTSDFGTAGGGEYPLQDGFGWTNGVLEALLARTASP